MRFPWLAAAAALPSCTSAAAADPSCPADGCRERKAEKVNITFYSRKDKKKRKRLSELYDAHDIQVFEEAEWSSPDLQSESILVLRSEALRRTTKVIASQLRTTLDEVALEPGELVDMLEDNFKQYFDPETEQLKTGRKRQRQKPIMWMLKVLLQPLVEEMKVALAGSIFPCDASRIHCGIWDWYLRGSANELRRHHEGKWPEDPSNYFEGIHLDGKLMLGSASREAEDIWGITPPNSTLNTPGPGWWNVWALLSPEIGRQTLALLDPRSWNVSEFLEHGKPFVWPERDFGTQPKPLWKVPLSMQMGDLLLFRSFEVAHGAGRLINSNSSAIRVSLDARCHCSEFDTRPVRTRKGEICAPVWYYEGQPQHGCQRIHSEEPWCIIYRQADEAGAGCILKNKSLCRYPCEAEDDCSPDSFDFCA